MLRNNKGFSLIESLAAASLLMIVITTLIPLTSLLLNERAGMEQKQVMGNTLHEELQPFLWEGGHSLPHKMSKTVKGSQAEFHFTNEKDLVKGCVTWENANERTNHFCLYGYPQK